MRSTYQQEEDSTHSMDFSMEQKTITITIHLGRTTSSTKRLQTYPLREFIHQWEETMVFIMTCNIISSYFFFRSCLLTELLGLSGNKRTIRALFSCTCHFKIYIPHSKCQKSMKPFTPTNRTLQEGQFLVWVNDKIKRYWQKSTFLSRVNFWNG